MEDIQSLIKKYFDEYNKRNLNRDKLYGKACQIKEIEKDIKGLLDMYQYIQITQGESDVFSDEEII